MGIVDCLLREWRGRRKRKVSNLVSFLPTNEGGRYRISLTTRNKNDVKKLSPCHALKNDVSLEVCIVVSDSIRSANSAKVHVASDNGSGKSAIKIA